MSKYTSLRTLGRTPVHRKVAALKRLQRGCRRTMQRWLFAAPLLGGRREGSVACLVFRCPVRVRKLQRMRYLRAHDEGLRRGSLHGDDDDNEGGVNTLKGVRTGICGSACEGYGYAQRSSGTRCSLPCSTRCVFRRSFRPLRERGLRSGEEFSENSDNKMTPKLTQSKQYAKPDSRSRTRIFSTRVFFRQGLATLLMLRR